jgi:hypothetical protein
MNTRPGTAGSYLCRGATGALLTLAALPAAAQLSPLTYQNLFFNQASGARSANYLAVDAGLIYSDNASLGANGPSDTLAEVGLIGNVTQSTALLDYHVDSDIALVKYLRDTYATEPTGYFDGKAELKIAPGFFSWIGRETYAQLAIEPFAPVTPDNLENVNYLTTGPRFTLRPTLRTTATLDLEYSYMDSASKSPLYINITNHRYGADLRIDRAFTSASSLYLKGKYEKVFFNDQIDNHNFTLGEGTLGYLLRDDRTDLDVGGGYTRVSAYQLLATAQRVPVLRSDDGTQLSQADAALAPADPTTPPAGTFSGANWQLSLARLITPTQRVALIASQKVIDPIALLQLDFDSPVPTIAPQEVAVGDPFINRAYGMNWLFQASRTSVNVSLLYEAQHYPLMSIDNRNLKVANGLLARQLSAVLNWDIGVSFYHEDPSTARPFNVREELTDLRWQIGQRVALRFIYVHSSFNGINDNQLAITAAYQVLGAAPGTTPPVLQPISPMSTQSHVQ